VTWIRARSVRLLLPLIVALWFIAPVASATTINFETLPDGSIPVEFSEVGGSYSTLGVTIGTLEANDFVVPKFRELAGPGAPPSLWVTDFGTDGTVGSHILLDFAQPVDFVSFDTWTASSIEFNVIGKALDENRSVIGTVESIPIFSTTKGRYTLEDVGPISFVWITTNQPFVAAVGFDNLEFEFVPEPSTALLLGFGLVGLGWRGRVRHSWR
jgi:hypothetical protein